MSTHDTHYGADTTLHAVEAALSRAGFDEADLTPADLGPLDQFHIRGIAATKELAEALKPTADMSILDVGCGLGGSARFLASTYHCHVTGIDLSQPFIDTAAMLTRRCGLADKVTLRQGDALHLPFPDAAFDAAWTQHVAMNIADRATLYRGVRRVLKPGGRFAIYDVVVGNGQPLIFPVPWSRRPETSFLLTPAAMRETLARAGFAEESWTDTTAAGLAWLEALQPRQSSPPPLGLHVVMGPAFAEMAANLARNIKEGRARVIQTIQVAKPH